MSCFVGLIIFKYGPNNLTATVITAIFYIYFSNNFFGTKQNLHDLEFLLHKYFFQALTHI